MATRGGLRRRLWRGVLANMMTALLPMLVVLLPVFAASANLLFGAYRRKRLTFVVMRSSRELLMVGFAWAA